MTVANLATNVRKALYGKMAGDGTLTGLLSSRKAPGRSQNIYYAYAPDGAGFPCVIFHKQAGTPLYTFKTGTTAGDAHAAADNEIWMIKGVAHDDYEIAAEDPLTASDNIASRLDVLLTDGTISISGASQLYLRRESDVSYVETSDGESYYHHGGLYRLWYSA